jgi:23S rRNA (adenine2503-C2)-methyltransferase
MLPQSIREEGIRSMLPVIDALASAAPPLPGFLSAPAAKLAEWLAARGQGGMRARQIRRWLLAGGAESFEQMTDLPAGLRQELAASFAPLATKVARHLRAADDTHKLLLELADGKRIECVLIQEGGRRTACISTQVGCGMGCVFCASGISGVERNLSAGEIVEQLIRLRNLPGPGGQAFERLTHIVVMGMGEPLANLDALLEGLQVATAKDGLGIGARHVHISTVGLPAQMRRLADLRHSYHLAVSLHAPNDALRSQIVPTHARQGLQAILDAAEYFQTKTGRQVTFEYVVLGGVNDDVSHARELARLLRGRGAHVNLIPFNDVEGLAFRRPALEAVATLKQVLEQHGISVKIRKRKGSEIDAACGQLRRRAEAESRAAQP